MTINAIHPETLRNTLAELLGDKVRGVTVALEEVTIEVPAANYVEVMQTLRNAPVCQFEIVMDLCGMYYWEHAGVLSQGPRFAAVSHLLPSA